jgi:DNA-binding beta-propeller fold protein YncE
MRVAIKHGPHGLVIVSEYRNSGGSALHMHSLADGSLVRRVGSQGSGKGQFNFDCGGLCVSPDGDSVLVAECFNHRVQQVRIVDGSWVRFVGEGVLHMPEFVDSNVDVIVVSENCHRISVFSWVDGSVRAQFGSEGSGPGQLRSPCGLRLLADGSGVVVADAGNHRLCLFTLSGEFVAAVGSAEKGLSDPCDVLECASDGSFIVANWCSHNLVKLNRDGAKVEMYGKKGAGNGEFYWPSALVALPDGGMVAREYGGKRFQVFRGFELRKTWITVCATLATHEWRTSVTTKRARVGGV